MLFTAPWLKCYTNANCLSLERFHPFAVAFFSSFSLCLSFSYRSVVTVKNPYFLIILWIAKVHFIYFWLYTFVSATAAPKWKKNASPFDHGHFFVGFWKIESTTITTKTKHGVWCKCFFFVDVAVVCFFFKMWIRYRSGCSNTTKFTSLCFVVSSSLWGFIICVINSLC